MPRAHTPQEQDRIRQRLLEAGREAFVRTGLAKVTIAQLAAAAGIGKGSFYRFFDSKEALFLAIQEHEEASFKQALVREGEAAGSPHQAVVGLLTAAATRLDDHPFLRQLLDPQTINALLVRIEPAQMVAHREADRDFFFSLVEDWKARGFIREAVSAQIVFDVLTALFVLSTQRELVGAELTERATAELAEALADRWCP